MIVPPYHVVGWCLLLSVGPALAQLELTWDLDVPVASVAGAALGDLDGDGDLDACLANYATAGQLLINDGSGHFVRSGIGPSLPSGGAAAFGDVDGDGDADLIYAAYFSPCKLYLNDGYGNLTDSGQAIGLSTIRGQIILTDLDGDTDLDLALPSDSSSQKNEVWLNDGSGVFVDTGQDLGQLFTICAAVGDVNGDTFPDLIMGNNGANTVWLNDGNAVFTQGTSLPLTGTTFGIELADLDGDTDLDAFVANGSISGQVNQVHLNDGNGVFTNLAQPLFTADYHTSVVLENFDGDTDVDVLVSRNRGQTNQVWLNDGSANFSLSAIPAGDGGSFGIARGDVDGDLDDDYLLASDSVSPRVLFRKPVGMGGPLVPSTQELAGTQATSAAFADLDGDTYLDVAIANVAGTISLLMNDGTGEFDDPGLLFPNPEGNNADSIQVGDLDGINGPDLVIFATAYTGAADGRDRIWLNDGSGGFTESAQVLDDHTGGSLKLADVDGVNGLDIIVANNTAFMFDGQNSIYFNDGSGNFTRSDALGTGSQSHLVVFNVDGDADLDVYLGGAGEDDKLWINDGSGVFTVSAQVVGTGSPRAVISADFNGDTYPDIFCANQSGGNRLWLNDASGNLTDSGVSIGPSFMETASAFDYDDDGDLDLWLGYGGLGPSEDRIMINDGTGSFSFGPEYADVPTRQVLIADFTGDGSEDAFVASGQGTHQLWSADVSPVAVWAATFGLVDEDTWSQADPDGDGLKNFEEMAFNLNPNLADLGVLADAGIAGEPRIVVQQPNPTTRRFRAVTMRRKSAPFLHYQLKTSAILGGFVEPGGVTTSVTSINADYDRVIYTFIPASTIPRNFAVFEVTYDP